MGRAVSSLLTRPTQAFLKSGLVRWHPRAMFDVFPNGRSEKRIAGICVTGGKLRTVELAMRRPYPVLAGRGEIDLPDKCLLENGEIRDQAAFCAALSELSTSVLGSKAVVAAVPGNAAIMRQVSLPSMSQKDLQEAVRWEAENFLPASESEWQLDFAPIDEAVFEGQKRMIVLVVAAPKSLVWQYYDSFCRCGLALEAIEVNLVAISRLPLATNDRGLFSETAAVVEINEFSTNVVLLTDGRFRFGRILKTGTYSVPGPEESNSITPVTTQVGQVLDLFSEKHRTQPVSKVFLTGFGAEMPKSVDLFSQELRVRTETLQISFPSSGGTEIIPPRFSAAAGLALRGVG